MLAVNVFVFMLFTMSHMVGSEKLVVCYYGTWATYRNGAGKFDVENINPNLCTHLIYSFMGIDNEGYVVSLDPYLDLPDNYGRDNFKKFNALKLKNPSLKTLLAVGGWNEGSAKYSIMAASPSLRKNFIDSALKMITSHGFDGLDIDWEYPNRRDSVHGSADIDNFTTLLRETREVFNKRGLLLTAAVSSVRDSASQSYDVAAICLHLDIVNLMTYDMYGAWDPVTGHNAPLHKGEGDEGAVANDLYTVDQALDYWISAGCPPEQIALGIPFYGRTFTLTNAEVNGVRAPASGAGIAGPYTATNGFLGYNEACFKLQNESWTQRYDSLAKVPYAYKNKNWVSYDNANSIASKIEYAKKLGITKAMVWSIETDDFHGTCGNGDNPLLTAINTALDDSEATSSTPGSLSTSVVVSSTLSSPSGNTESSSTLPSLSTTKSSTTIIGSSPSTTDFSSTLEPSLSTTNSPSTASDSVCKLDGYSANPEDCSSFYYCIRDASGTITPVAYKCPSYLYWDQTISVCNYQQYVNCKA